jgi:hypothetical protein
MPDDDEAVGYKRPPVHSRFRKGQSGNPLGRPKKVPDFLQDAVSILSAPVTGHANGKPVTLPAPQAMFRGLCRKALKGDNAALRRVIDLMLKLEPEAQQKAEQKAQISEERRRKFWRSLGLDPDEPYEPPKEPDPKMERINKQAAAMAKEERKRLIRKYQRLGRLR